MLEPVHALEFFRKRGLFCRPDFLDDRARVELLSHVHTTIPTPARVFHGGADAVVDMAARNTWQVPLELRAAELHVRIGALRDELAVHFNLPLVTHEGPTLLLYQPGGFYEPHVDRAGAGDGPIPPGRRAVSVVIFLNAIGDAPTGGYTGGALTFYGLVDDPAWREYGFAIDPAPGLLVAFPSHLVHQVTPVTAGDRYTVVDWFTV